MLSRLFILNNVNVFAVSSEITVEMKSDRSLHIEFTASSYFLRKVKIE